MKNILMTQRHSKNHHGQYTDSLENTYIDYFESLDLNVIPVSNVKNKLDNMLEYIDFSGIILTGGGDVDPEIFGQEYDLPLNISKQRDKTEYDLLNYAIKNRTPVLGICRGMQLINVYFGGSLIRDAKLSETVGTVHDLFVIDKKMCDTLGKDIFQVNTYHNFAVLQNILGNDLVIFALDDKSRVEGYYHQTLPIWGVQWHPERNNPGKDLDQLIINYSIL